MTKQSEIERVLAAIDPDGRPQRLIDPSAAREAMALIRRLAAELNAVQTLPEGDLPEPTIEDLARDLVEDAVLTRYHQAFVSPDHIYRLADALGIVDVFQTGAAARERVEAKGDKPLYPGDMVEIVGNEPWLEEWRDEPVRTRRRP